MAPRTEAAHSTTGKGDSNGRSSPVMATRSASEDGSPTSLSSPAGEGASMGASYGLRWWRPGGAGILVTGTGTGSGGAGPVRPGPGRRRAKEAPCPTRKAGWSTMRMPTSWRRRRGCVTMPRRRSATACPCWRTRAATSCARRAIRMSSRRTWWPRSTGWRSSMRRPSTGPTRSPRSWRARTLRRRGRSSRRTGPGRWTCSGSRASWSSTRSTTPGCTTSSTGATWSSPMRRHGRTTGACSSSVRSTAVAAVVVRAAV